MTQTLNDLPTPSLILDRSRLLKNIARMQARAKTLGVTLRPHLKTAKSAMVAELAVGKAGAINAGLLAAAILALNDPALSRRLQAWRAKQTRAIAQKPVSEKKPRK